MPIRSMFKAPKTAREAIRVGGKVVEPGTVARFELPVAQLYTGTGMSLPIAVYHGNHPGPRLWLSAALHGDEINGVEIIYRVLQRITPETLQGTLVVVPVVNVFGFINQSRYLPDRRDLNRSFPGSSRGSSAARLAKIFLKEVVEPCEYGIDFHTGSMHRENLAQIRANLSDPEVRRLSEAFGAPFIYNAKQIPGTLRAIAKKMGKHLLLFEGGEPMRFDQHAIEIGVSGTLRVLDALGMRAAPSELTPSVPCFEGSKTRWLRAGRSGVFRRQIDLGERVRRGQVLGTLSGDFFSPEALPIKASFDGMVICFTNNPLVNEGDALIHIAAGQEVSRVPS